ncbi:MAG: hypothetical protein RLN75_06335, partial [Longimicrobiales bacterium]
MKHGVAIESRPTRRWARRVVAGCAALVGIGACGDGATEPGDDRRVEVVSGDAQVGVVGRRLPNPVVVRVVNGSGPVAGVEPDIEVVGGGSVLVIEPASGPDGHVSVGWTLGPVPASPQELRIRVGEARALVTAEAVPEEAGDLVVTGDPALVLRGIVVLHDDPEDLPIRIVEVVHGPAPVDRARLQQYAAGSLGVVVFPAEGPPVRLAFDATSGIDTLTAGIPAALALDLEVDVHARPFEAQVERFGREVAALAPLLRSLRWGVRIGDVRFHDRTDEPVGPVDGAEECRRAGPTQRIRVRLVDAIVGNSTGYGCPPGYVFLADDRRDGPHLLAHELGHTFGLGHTDEGLMGP